MQWVPVIFPPTPPPPSPSLVAPLTWSGVKPTPWHGSNFERGSSSRLGSHLCYPPVGRAVTLPSLGILPPTSALSVVPVQSATSSTSHVVWSSPQVTATASGGHQVSTASQDPQVPHVQPTGTTVATAVSLSPASEPFPAKLVERIRSGQFVEMRELMTDNIALLQQLEAFNTSPCPIPNLPGILQATPKGDIIAPLLATLISGLCGHSVG